MSVVRQSWQEGGAGQFTLKASARCSTALSKRAGLIFPSLTAISERGDGVVSAGLDPFQQTPQSVCSSRQNRIAGPNTRDVEAVATRRRHCRDLTTAHPGRDEPPSPALLGLGVGAAAVGLGKSGPSLLITACPLRLYPDGFDGLARLRANPSVEGERDEF